jgi:hypothetical protein
VYDQNRMPFWFDKYCHIRPILNFSLTENLASLCLQETTTNGR